MLKRLTKHIVIVAILKRCFIRGKPPRSNELNPCGSSRNPHIVPAEPLLSVFTRLIMDGINELRPLADLGWDLRSLHDYSPPFASVSE